MLKIDPEINIDKIERSFFKKGNPLKKLLKVALGLLRAEEVGILYGSNATGERFLPSDEWDRGIADMFDGMGVKGLALKYLGRAIVSYKQLSPVYFYKTDESGDRCDNDGMIAYTLRTCVNYYRQGISVIFNPDISSDIFQIDEQYAEMPMYNYNGNLISKPNFRHTVDLNIVRHFRAKNYVSIYIPDYGILVANTVDPDLLSRNSGRFVHEKQLQNAFDTLIHLVEVASLAALGRLKGRRGTYLLQKKEAQLRKTSQALIENETKYRDLYENAPIAYFSMDINGTILKVNQTTLALSGYEKDELIGHNILEFYVHHRGEVKSIDALRSIIDSCRSVKDLEMKFRNKKNRLIWVSLCVDTVRDKEDRMIEIRATAVDVSERKQLETQLLQARKMEAVGTMASGIAHDFNNILTPISGYSEILSAAPEPMDPQLRDQFRIIHNCARYARGLVNQMLTFSHQKTPELCVLDPHLFIRETLSLVEAFLPSGVNMDEQIDPGCGVIRVDPIQIHQVIMNLITNACQALGKTGGDIRVLLEPATNPFPGDRQSQYLCLAIEDNGPGMSEKVKKRIFEPFFTTKADGKGSGIGLSVVQGILESHGGKILVSSRPGKGSCFKVYLPVYEGDKAPDRAEINPEGAACGDERLLLVDDDERVAGLMRFALTHLGYSVTAFTSGLEALAYFQKFPETVDLIITDLTMPDITGDQLAEKVYPIRPDIPVLLSTGFGEHMDPDRTKAGHVYGVLKKPMTLGQLSKMVRTALDHPDKQLRNR